LQSKGAILFCVYRCIKRDWMPRGTRSTIILLWLKFEIWGIVNFYEGFTWKCFEGHLIIPYSLTLLTRAFVVEH